MSSILFNIYVNNILMKLNGFGCHIGNLSYSAFLYADDLVLLAPSVNELKRMVNICCQELTNVGLKLNCAKCNCLRFGKKFNATIEDISTIWFNSMG